MFCPKCGNQIPDGSKFCPKCGSQLGQAPAPAAAPATQPAASPYVAPVRATPGTDVLKIGRIVAAAVAIIAFFLPIVSFGAFGISASMSPMQMATGTQVMGFDMDGQAENFLFLAIGVLALVLALLPGRAGAIGGIVSGVLTIGFLLLWQSQAIGDAGSYATLEIGFYLYILAGLALAALGIASLVKKSWSQTLCRARAGPLRGVGVRPFSVRHGGADFLSGMAARLVGLRFGARPLAPHW